MFGARERIGRMQRVGLRLLEIFEDHGRLEDRGVVDEQHGRLAERRVAQEPVRLVGEVDVAAGERYAFLRQRYYGALHIRAELVADKREPGWVGHLLFLINALACI